MKNTLFSIFIFSVILLIGCQENSITDPAQVDLQKTGDPHVQQGTMKLEGDLTDPRGLFDNNYKILTISGAVKFEHSFEYLQNNYSTPQIKVHLNMNMIAEIKDRNSTHDITYPIWSLSGVSNDIIYFTDNKGNDNIVDLNNKESQKTLYKYYAVRGSDVGMRLVCKFYVTTNGVSLSDYQLQLQNTDGTYLDSKID